MTHAKLQSPAPPRPVDTVLRLAIFAGLLFACFKIAEPFVGLLIWAVILAVILHPLHGALRARIGLGNAATATIIGLVLTALLLVPVLVVIGSIADSLIEVLQGLKAGTLTMPPVPPRLATIPLIGSNLAAAWAEADANLPATIEHYRPVLTDIMEWLGKFVGSMTTTVLTFAAALVLAAIIIAYAEPAARFAHDAMARLMSGRRNGDRVLHLSVATIRGVTNGVIGVAFIQAVLVGAGFFAIGVPGAGLLALAVMLLGIVQVPVLIIVLPVVVYAFASLPTTSAVVFTIWSLVAGLSDAVLKPLLLGRGLDVPMPVILIGVIGGVIAGGLVGLFIGPVVLGIGYMLCIDWVRADSAPE